MNFNFLTNISQCDLSVHGKSSFPARKPLILMFSIFTLPLIASSDTLMMTVFGVDMESFHHNLEVTSEVSPFTGTMTIVPPDGKGIFCVNDTAVIVSQSNSFCKNQTEI